MFSFLGFSFTVGNCSWPPQAYLFQSALCLLVTFCLLTIGVPSLCSPGQSDPTTTWILCASKFVPFCLASSRFHMSPVVPHSPLQFHMPEWNSSPTVCLISVDDITQCPGQRLQKQSWVCFLSSPCSVSYQNLMVAPPKYISFHCPHCHYITNALISYSDY